MPVKFLSRWTSRTFGQFFRLTFSPFTYFQSSINCFEKKNLDMAIILNMFSMCSVYVWVQRERVHGSHSGVSKADLVLAAVPLSVVASWSFSQAPNPFRMLQPPPHNVDNMPSHSSNYLWLIGAEWNFQLCLIQFTFPPFVDFCQLLWAGWKKRLKFSHPPRIWGYWLGWESMCVERVIRWCVKPPILVGRVIAATKVINMRGGAIMILNYPWR